MVTFLFRGPNRVDDRRPRPSCSAAISPTGSAARGGELILAGPFLDDTDLRGIAVFDSDSVEEGAGALGRRPGWKAGTLRVGSIPGTRQWIGIARPDVEDPPAYCRRANPVSRRDTGPLRARAGPRGRRSRREAGALFKENSAASSSRLQGASSRHRMDRRSEQLIVSRIAGRIPRDDILANRVADSATRPSGYGSSIPLTHHQLSHEYPSGRLHRASGGGGPESGRRLQPAVG